MLFFSRGEPWGTFNDASSVVLMHGMIPVALVTAVFLMECVTTVALVASTPFLTLLGKGLVSGDLVVPAWNA